MFFLIRDANYIEVLGIVNEHEVLESSEIDQEIARCAKHGMLESYRKGNVMSVVLINIIRSNLNLEHWIWEGISQAEFETYRDLHGFRVLVRQGI